MMNSGLTPKTFMSVTLSRGADGNARAAADKGAQPQSEIMRLVEAGDATPGTAAIPAMRELLSSSLRFMTSP